MIHSQDESEFSPGIIFDLGYTNKAGNPAAECKEKCCQEFKPECDACIKECTKALWVDHAYGCQLTGALAENADINPDPISLNAHYGLFLLRAPTAKLQGENENSKTLTAKLKGEDETTELTATMRLALSGNIESDQNQENQIASAGAYFSFRNYTYKDWWQAIPDFSLRMEAAQDLDSEAAALHGSENDSFSRFKAEASHALWLSQLTDVKGGFLEYSSLLLEARYHREFGRTESWKAEGLEEAWYGAATYSIGGLLWERYKWPVGDIFLRVSTGRLPPNLENDTRIILGINLLPEKASE